MSRPTENDAHANTPGSDSASQQKRILVCESDENLSLLLHEYLQAKGFTVDCFSDGEAGWRAYLAERYNFCIFEANLQKMDGFALATEIRKTNRYIPIVFLTSRSTKDDIITGFKIGADDYITKPFSMEELYYRVVAILRRFEIQKERKVTEVRLGSMVFDAERQILKTSQRDVKLTTKESALLSLLIQTEKSMLERNFALKSVWSEDNYFNARSMDVYITKLRKLLKDDPEVQIINIHGKGYRLVTPSGKKPNK